MGMRMFTCGKLSDSFGNFQVGAFLEDLSQFGVGCLSPMLDLPVLQSLKCLLRWTSFADLNRHARCEAQEWDQKRPVRDASGYLR